jgi:hypothetical protein
LTPSVYLLHPRREYQTMKKALLTFLIFILTHFMYSGGCSNIETPVREGTEGLQETGELVIQCDHTEILDTEPLLLFLEGGTGDVFWCVQPENHGSFSPDTGEVVLFTPADISEDCSVTVTAEDSEGSRGQLTLYLVDEGAPPSSGEVLINEIAWAGTVSSAYDEYIELVNKSDRPFYLNNWYIENAAGMGTPLSFSGRIDPASLFIIANYAEGSEKTALSCPVQVATASLSISNSTFGPFVLNDAEGSIMDSVGDGGSHTLGINTPETRSPISRYTWSDATQWSQDSWYTESQSVNLTDGTLGTPGAPNSDKPFYTGPGEDDALAILTEYAVDPTDDIDEDWVEIHITRSGSMQNFVITDLDGQDESITHGVDIQAEAGDYWLIVWHDYPDDYDIEAQGYIIGENLIYIPENPPTGTKDQIVLLCSAHFLDGLCYYTEGNDPFDNDEQLMRDYGWTGDPVLGKYGAKRYAEGSLYDNTLAAESWNVGADPSPGAAN